MTQHRSMCVEQFAQSRQGVRLIDVREREEFEGALRHVEGAELVPLGRLSAEALVWDRGAPIACICKSGGRSAMAAVTLARLGFANVTNVTGGMIAWNAAGLPVE